MAVYRTDGTMVTCGVTEAEMPSDGIFIVRSAGENVKGIGGMNRRRADGCQADVLN